MARSTTTILLAALALGTTLASAHDHHDHHRARGALPDGGFHPRDSPIHALFARQTPSNAPIGSPQWIAQYPPVEGVPSPAIADIPPLWLAAYNASKAAGHIPDIPVTTIPPAGGNPTYPAGIVPTDSTVCSGTLKCRATGDIWDAPNGTIGISFDDGPVAVAPVLYAFLHANKIPSTHFMIGRVILGDLQSFQEAYSTNQASIAVHTWSHPLMTTQTDLQQVVEIGWTMQLIHDLTGGRVPRFWRPPLGDCDNRCRAIATTVFNLTTVFWNHDTEDWSLAAGGTTGPWIAGNLTQWLSGPKSPGLIILEHELTNDTVNYFMNTTYPNVVKYNWTMHNIPDLFGYNWYQNAANDVGATTTSVPIALAVAATGAGGSGGSGASGTAGAGAPAGTAGTGAGTRRAGASVAGVLAALVVGVLALVA